MFFIIFKHLISTTHKIKIKIGSCTNKQKVLTNERLIQICKKIHELNPICKIKLNTVVCLENFNEKLSEFFLSEELSLNKWKFLKCQCFEGNERMCITEAPEGVPRARLKKQTASFTVWR